MKEKIVFLAIISPIATAIAFDGQGGARVKLDVSEHDIAPIMRLSILRGKVIKVTVEESVNGKEKKQGRQAVQDR